jgi:hypothetical protein
MSDSSRRSKAKAEGPVAARGWAEAVKNILRRVFANVLRLIPLCGTQPRSGDGAQAFLQAFLERAPDGHRFADAFHLRGERGVGLLEFLEGKARNLGDDVINARLEARGGFARDVVLEFVEQVADGELDKLLMNLLFTN